MLRVSEVYASYQGEGPNTGKPTVFVRFAGCNLKCPGWPCDTQHAIDPKIFTKEQKHYTPQALANEIMKQYPAVDNICYTGGEVFLQSSDDLESLMGYLANLHTADVSQEVFTNGTLAIPRSIREYLGTIVLDWKLPGSGESTEALGGLYLGNEQDQTYARRNIRTLGPSDAIKFTIKNRHDYAVAKQRWDHLRLSGSFGGVVYCGVVWDEIDTSELAGWMLEDKLPWRLNVQVHKYIWHPEARRT